MRTPLVERIGLHESVQLLLLLLLLLLLVLLSGGFCLSGERPASRARRILTIDTQRLCFRLDKSVLMEVQIKSRWI
jgi:hypothetical protein